MSTKAVFTPGTTTGPVTGPVTPVGGTALTAADPSVTTTVNTAIVTVPNTSGMVTLQLVVTDAAGNVSAPALVQIGVKPTPPPVVTVAASPDMITPGEAISLTATSLSGSYMIAKYEWTLVTEEPTPVLNPVPVGTVTDTPQI
jgi:hypothetical protein